MASPFTKPVEIEDNDIFETQPDKRSPSRARSFTPDFITPFVHSFPRATISSSSEGRELDELPPVDEYTISSSPKKILPRNTSNFEEDDDNMEDDDIIQVFT